MSIRSRFLAIGVAVIAATALGGIAKADDQMPAGAPASDGVQNVTGSPQGAGNAGQGGGAAFDREGRMGGQEDRGRPLDPRAEERAGRMDPDRPNPTRGTPFSKGY
jgi:hypothetical protein